MSGRLTAAIGPVVVIAVRAMIARTVMIVRAMVAHAHLIAARITAIALPMSRNPIPAVPLAGNPIVVGPPTIRTPAIRPLMTATVVAIRTIMIMVAMVFVHLFPHVLSHVGNLPLEAVQFTIDLSELAVIEMPVIYIVPQPAGFMLKVVDFCLELSSFAW